MKYILILILSCFLGNAVSAQTVAEFVRFQQAKLVTYEQAVKLHQQTKKKVLVWVDHEDIKVWNETKDEYIHCFVKSFAFTTRGVVMGGDDKGQFVKLKVIPVENLAKQISGCPCEKCGCDPCLCPLPIPVAINCVGGT